MKRLATTIFSILMLVLVSGFVGNLAYAGTAYQGYVPLEPSFIGQNPNEPTPVMLGDYVKRLYKTAVILAIVLSVFMVVWGGFEYLSTDAIGGKDDAKKKFYDVIFGLVLVFGSWVILNTINPNLVKSDLYVDSLGPVPGFNVNSEEISRTRLHTALAEADELEQEMKRRGDSLDAEEIVEYTSKIKAIRGEANTIRNIDLSEQVAITIMEGANEAFLSLSKLQSDVADKRNQMLVYAQREAAKLDDLGYPDKAKAVRDAASASVNKINAKLNSFGPQTTGTNTSGTSNSNSPIIAPFGI